MQFIAMVDNFDVSRRVFVGRIPCVGEQIIARKDNTFALFGVNNVRHMGDFMDSDPNAETAIVHVTFLHFLGKDGN